MRIRKANKEEEYRIQQITGTVHQIYTHAVKTAEQTTDTRYLYALPDIPNMNPRHIRIQSNPTLPDFHRTNMAEILVRLQSLFPDCVVELTTITLATTQDGKTHDLSKMETILKPFIIREHPTKEYIVVDWS
jgi:hypothetical protein